MEKEMEQVIYVARLSASLILANGGETYRAEETAVRIGNAFGYDMDVIAFPTGLTMSVARDGETGSSIARVSKRTTNLSKLERVNAVSRALASGETTLDEAALALRKINREKTPAGWRAVCAAGGTAAMFALMFVGSWFDVLAAGVIGAAVQGALGWLPDQEGMPLSCLIGGFLAASLAFAAVSACRMGDSSRIIWSVMMPLLPGLAFTNGIRDSMHGDMVSGGARISDAVMRAVVLAAGAGMAMWVYLRLGGVMT